MTFKYSGKTWMRDQESFSFPSLYNYIEETKQHLMEPLPVPAYATAGEAEKIVKLSELYKKEPFRRRTAFNENMSSINAKMTSIKMISYGKYPEVYEVCLFATKQLKYPTPLIHVYSTKDEGLRYNAFASDYQDKVMIYLSQRLCPENKMLTTAEFSFIVGHELGHAQCHHTTIRLDMQNSTSDREYSADRAGLIVCTKWILEHDKNCTLEETIKRAVLAAVSALSKITTAAVSSQEVNWQAFDYDVIQNSIDHVFEGASKLGLSQSTHPYDRHRTMAMKNFSQSELFYRCIGQNPAQYSNLFTDQQLRDIMSYQLIHS